MVDPSSDLVFVAMMSVFGREELRRGLTFDDGTNTTENEEKYTWPWARSERVWYKSQRLHAVWQFYELIDIDVDIIFHGEFLPTNLGPYSCRSASAVV